MENLQVDEKKRVNRKKENRMRLWLWKRARLLVPNVTPNVAESTWSVFIGRYTCSFVSGTIQPEPQKFRQKPSRIICARRFSDRVALRDQQKTVANINHRDCEKCWMLSSSSSSSRLSPASAHRRTLSIRLPLLSFNSVPPTSNLRFISIHLFFVFFSPFMR